MTQQDFEAEMRKFYITEYIKKLHLESITNPQIRSFLQNSDFEYWSTRNRITRNIQILKHTFLMNRTNIIAVCFKLTLNATSCIYAFLYASNEINKKSRKNNIKNIFVCTGPTFRSQDGEYRGRVIQWEQFTALFEKYADIFSLVEQSVLSKLESGELTFQTDFFYPMNVSNTKQFEESINTLRLPIKFYILCWMHDFYNIHFKIAENHMNPAYQYIFYQEDDLPIFNKIMKKLTQSQIYSLQVRIANHYSADIDRPDYNILDVSCGQKIFPLTSIEAVKTDDINFNVWREIYIANMMSNLVLNIISPSFPFINNWFYIQHSHAGLFDNLAMHDKYAHSDIAAGVSAQLKNIDKYNYVSGDRKKEAVSGKFYRLSKSIHKSIIYADSDIKLTDLSVCVTSEYVGRTLRDIPAIIMAKQNLYGLDLVFTNFHTFSKHMFEFCYAFYCMNSKSGILHGDLHMNNASISRLYLMVSLDGTQYVKNPHIVFSIDNSIAFVFPHNGLFSMILDFSRAIIGDYEKIEHEYSSRFAEMYFKEQRIRVMQTIYHYFPKLITKYHDKIESLLTLNFPLMFKIITCIDTYVLMTNISGMFSIDDVFTQGKVKIAPGAVDFLSKLISSAESLFSSNMLSAIEGQISSPDDIEWPNLVIIKKHFAPYILTPEKTLDKNINVVEFFNAQNPITNEIEDYDTWGPLLSLDKEIELRKKYNLHDEGITDWIKFKSTDESNSIESLTYKYAQQEKDVLELESWMIT